MGMLSHLVAILGGIIGAIIMYCCMNNKSAFINHHIRESLNFQLTLVIVEVSLVVIGAVAGILTAGLALLVVVPLFFIIYILFLIWEILACLAANKGQWGERRWRAAQLAGLESIPAVVADLARLKSLLPLPSFGMASTAISAEGRISGLSPDCSIAALTAASSIAPANSSTTFSPFLPSAIAVARTSVSSGNSRLIAPSTAPRLIISPPILAKRE